MFRPDNKPDDDKTMMKVAVTVAGGITCFSGYFASNKLTDLSMGATDITNLSFFTPDQPTYSIWWLNLLLVGAMVFAQWCPTDEIEYLLRQQDPMTKLDVRARITAALLANTLWFYFFSQKVFFLAWVFGVVDFLAILSVLTTLNTKFILDFIQWFLFVVPNVVHASWVLILSMLSCSLSFGPALGLTTDIVIGGDMGVQVAGPPALAVAGICIVGLVACVMAIARLEFTWSMVAAWALAGIYRMQLPASTSVFPANGVCESVANAALWGTVITILVSAVSCAIILFAPEPKPCPPCPPCPPPCPPRPMPMPVPLV